jgi:hypothetical protein
MGTAEAGAKTRAGLKAARASGTPLSEVVLTGVKKGWQKGWDNHDPAYKASHAFVQRQVGRATDLLNTGLGWMFGA